jgi:fluoroacetyl-CoA thioesterase
MAGAFFAALKTAAAYAKLKKTKKEIINMLEAGITGRAETVVDHSNTAKFLGSGELEVFATPAMIALMEQTCQQSVAGELEPGQGTVGTHLDISHDSATPLGMKVHVDSVLTEVDGRRLVFEVKAYDECGLIGQGKHERFIIFSEKFLAKTNAKLSK